MPSRCEPASLVKSPITAGGGGVGGLGGERKGGGGDWVRGEVAVGVGDVLSLTGLAN